MIVAGQQGTDTAATEAVLVLSKELGAGGLLAPLLDKINIIFVPRANPRRVCTRHCNHRRRHRFAARPPAPPDP